MQALKYITLGILIGLITTAAILVIASPPSGTEVELLPSPTQPKMTVYISGAVAKTGLFILQPGSRVADAISVAGGSLPDADLSGLNLAQKLTDGQNIHIPRASDPTSFPDKNTTVNFLIDLNTATVEQLDQLPGIGATKAEAIIAYRQKIGGFDKIEQILDVPGIGPALYDELKEMITVTPGN